MSEETSLHTMKTPLYTNFLFLNRLPFLSNDNVANMLSICFLGYDGEKCEQIFEEILFKFVSFAFNNNTFEFQVQ